jgi:hypothetical protein
MPRTMSEGLAGRHGENRTTMLTIDVAKATSFTLLCVVQSACPVDSNVALASVQTRRSLHCSACADTAELEETVKDGTIVADVVLALLLCEVLHVVWGDFVEELDVLVGVELRHFVL